MEVKRPPWLSNNRPLFSLGLDLPVSRAAIHGPLLFSPLFAAELRNCSGPKFHPRWAWCAKVFQFHPQGCSLSMGGLARLPCGVAAVRSPAGSVHRSPGCCRGQDPRRSPLQPWQACKVAEAAVFKHCVCRQLHSMKSLKGTRIAGAEKLGV